MPLNHASRYADLTDEQYGMIGRLVIEWSNVEFLLGLLVSRLLLTPEFLGRVYSDEMSASRLQNALRKAVEIHRTRYRTRLVPAETLDEISKINSDVEKYRSLRNKFSHYCWMRANDDESIKTTLEKISP